MKYFLSALLVCAFLSGPAISGDADDSYIPSPSLVSSTSPSQGETVTGNFSTDEPGIQSFYLKRTKREKVSFSYKGEEFNGVLIADLKDNAFYKHLEDFLTEAREIKPRKRV